MSDERVVIVTGASGGIGAWVARWLGKAGVGVVLLARSGDRLREVAADVERHGASALTVTADVADPQACRGAVETALERFGRLDGLVNNAALVGPLALTAQTDPAAWRRNIEVDLLGPFFMARFALPALRITGGRIVNVSSGAATIAIRGAGAYCASKAGLNHLTRVIAAEEPGIICLVVRPGVADTNMQKFLRERGPGAMPPEEAAYYHDIKDKNRLEHPAVPARSIAWLSLHAPREWSGAFMDYDDPRVAEPAAKLYGQAYPQSPQLLQR